MDSATSAAFARPGELPDAFQHAAALADDYAGARGMDIYRDLALLGGFADLDVRYAGPAQLLLDVVPDLEVLPQ